MPRITANDLEQLFSDVAAAGSYGCFEYQGLGLGFHSDEASLLAWFAAFFGGYFTLTANPRADATVYSSRDPAVFERLKECARSHGRPRSDTEVEYAVDAQHRVVHSCEESKGRVEEHCFVLSDDGREVLVSSPGPVDDHRTTVKRSLRNLVKLLFVERGWVPLHAAACTWDGVGICILGGKFAGKTSTLLNLLVRPGARLVTNDNLFLRDGGSVLEGCGFPNKAGLRIGVLVAYPRLVDWIERTTDSFYPQIDAATFREIVATTPPEELGARSEKIVLLPTELAEQLDVPIQQVTPIDLFLAVRFDPALGQSRLVPVTDPRQMRDLLAASFRTLDKEKQDFLQDFFAFDDVSVEAAFDGLLDKFAARVTVQELYQNADTNEQSAALVAELTQRLHQPA
jgi:hypothetical protein